MIIRYYSIDGRVYKLLDNNMVMIIWLWLWSHWVIIQMRWHYDIITWVELWVELVTWSIIASNISVSIPDVIVLLMIIIIQNSIDYLNKQYKYCPPLKAKQFHRTRYILRVFNYQLCSLCTITVMSLWLLLL